MQKNHKIILGVSLLAATIASLEPSENTRVMAFGADLFGSAETAQVENVLKPSIVAYSMSGIENKTGIATGYSLNVRNNPWGSTIGIMSQGDKVEILNAEKDWLKINFNGQNAYVHSSWVSVDGYDYTIPLDGFLIGESIDCYDENGKIIGQIKEEKNVDIIADADKFWLVKTDEGMFYVLKDSVDCDDSGTETAANIDSDDSDDDDGSDDTGDSNDGPFTEFIANLDDELEADEPTTVTNNPTNLDEDDDDSDDGSSKSDGSDADDNEESDDDDDAVASTVATAGTSTAATTSTAASTSTSTTTSSSASSSAKSAETSATTTKTTTSSTTSSGTDIVSSAKNATVTNSGNSSATSDSSSTKAVTAAKTTSSTYSEKSYRTLQSKKVELPKGEKIYFLDVSDVPPTWKKKGKNLEKGSDCIILESNGKFGMIDAGINNTKEYGLNMTNRIWRYLKELGATNLEFVLFSHTHGDHDGCFKALVNKGLKVKTLYIKRDKAGRYDTDVKYGKKAGATIYNVNKHDSTKFKLGDMSFVLYNTKILNYSEKNMNTIGVVATMHGKRVYLAGDMQSPKKGTKVADNVAKKIGKVDVYKVAHHGYVSPGTGLNNSVKSISYLQPKYAVITNTNRRLNSSHSSVVKRLKKYASKKHIYFAGSGTVVMNISDKGKITFKQLSANK